MSRKRLRWWYRLKWAGVAASVALFATIVLQPTKITFKNTEVWLHNSVIIFFQSLEPGTDDFDWGNWKVDIANNPGFLPKYRRVTTRAGTLRYISLPPRLPLVLMVLATSLLWRLVPRYPSGCCKECGYDLTGNVTGVCSECGTEVEPG